jgi:ketosteroid isomerase-like protein
MENPNDFAADWIAAWNAHDIDRILSHYAQDTALYSPRVAAYMAQSNGMVRGKPALRDYFARGLSRTPDLRFELEDVYAGIGSVVVRYRARNGRRTAELMVFDADGLVREVRAHDA